MKLDKNILSQIESIRSELEDLRERLKKIENKKLKVVTDSVKGSSSTYPYIQHNCVIEGVEYPKNRHTRNKYRRLIKNKEYKLEKLINELEYNLIEFLQCTVSFCIANLIIIFRADYSVEQLEEKFRKEL